MNRLRIHKTQQPNPESSAAVYLLAITIALLTGAIFLAAGGYNPWETYQQTFQRVFFRRNGMIETLVRAIPIYMGAYAVALAARLKLWNIGVEGQFLIGAFAASGIALHFTELSPFLLLPLMLLAAFVAGGLLGFISAVPKAWFGINEIIVTLLLNYVVILWVAYLVHGPWKSPDSFVPQTRTFVETARLPLLISDTRLHSGILIVLLMAVLLEIIMTKTTAGYMVSASGSNQRAALTAGIDHKKMILLVMFFSGGLAGIGGMLEVSGTIHRLQEGMYPFYTMSAVMTAWLARLNTWAILPTGFLVAGLLTASYSMQIMGLPGAVVTILQAVILFAVIALAPLSYYKISFTAKKEASPWKTTSN